MNFTRGQEVTVTYNGWHFTALYLDSRAGGRSCGLNVANPGTSPYAPGRFVAVPMRCMTVCDPAAAVLAAEVLGQYGFTAEDIRKGIAEGGSISVAFTEPEAVLSGICEAGIADWCRSCHDTSCTHSCHGGVR